MSNAARQSRLDAAAAGEYRYMDNAEFDAIPLVTTPVRLPSQRILELYSKPEPLTAEEWAEWERLAQ